MVFRTLIKMMTEKKPKPTMKPIEFRAQIPERTETISRIVFDIVKDHGPLTINQIWERFQAVNLDALKNKKQLKIVMRWMKERQKVKLFCNHVGPNKQFLYTTWFTKANTEPSKSRSHGPNEPSKSRSHGPNE